MNKLRDELTIIYKYLWDECLSELKQKTKLIRIFIDRLINDFSIPTIFMRFKVRIYKMRCDCCDWSFSESPSICWNNALIILQRY